MKIDFHVHTKYSDDSSIDPYKLAKLSKKLGIVPAITDHNSIKANDVFLNLGADYIPGEEIRTDIGDLIVLFVSQDHDLIPKGTSFMDAIDKIKEQDGISILPHGFDPTRGNIGEKYPKLSKKVDFIEGFNGRCLSKENNNKALEFAKENKKFLTCGSDSHFLFEFGKTYLEFDFKFQEFDIEQLRKALKKGGKIVGEYSPKWVRGTTTIYKYIKRFLL